MILNRALLKRLRFRQFLWYVVVRLFLKPLGKRRIHVLNRLFPRLERAVVKRISRSRGNVFVDVGAALGDAAYIASKNYSKVLAFEPQTHNRSNIEYWVKHENIKNVEVRSEAVSNKKGFAHFGAAQVPDKEVNYFMFSIMPQYRAYSDGSLITINTKPSCIVKTVTVAEIVEQVGDVDLIKVDVEGAEWLVLEGAEPVMSHVKAWIIEVHDLDQKPKLREYMSKLNYSSIWLDSCHLYSVSKMQVT